jgi:hypothetical protein
MDTSPPASNILLVTSVMARIEAALSDLWAMPGQDLKQKIDNLSQHRVQGHVIGALHYLRIERNHVLHHPCRPLRDVERFRTLANAVLPVIERQPQGGLPAVRLSEQLRGMVADRMAGLNLHTLASASTQKIILESLGRLNAAYFKNPTQFR